MIPLNSGVPHREIRLCEGIYGSGRRRWLRNMACFVSVGTGTIPYCGAIMPTDIVAFALDSMSLTIALRLFSMLPPVHHCNFHSQKPRCRNCFSRNIGIGDMKKNGGVGSDSTPAT